MEEEEEICDTSNDFPLKVSGIVKLIQEKITKNVYKFIYDNNEENPDQDFYLRFSCIQSWFIRCSFKSKVDFLKKCAYKVNEINLLVTIINTLYTVSSKDRIYSLARGNFQATDMKLLPDDNRCLDKVTLDKVMTNEINWFKTLSNNKQYIFLIKLITLADGLVVMNNIFAHFIGVLITLSKKKKTYPQSRSRVNSLLSDQNEQLKEKIQYYFNNIVLVKPKENISKNELFALLQRWNNFIIRYNEQVNTPEDLTQKKDKADDAIDSIQRHPIWVNMSILSKLNNIQTMSKVNEYWTSTVKEFKGELAARKLLNKEINALEGQIKTINFNKNIPNELPEFPDRTTDITKPSFRKMLQKPKDMVTHSLISEVYKDYLLDSNLNSKKLQSFPRAMILKNKPNIYM